MSNTPTPITLAYHTVDELEVKLDLYLPPSASGAIPAIVAFHGGFLTVGDRRPSPFIPMWMLDMCHKEGFAFISADYRLLFPGSGFDQIADVQALFAFLANGVNAHLPAGNTIDAARLAVAGVSAGGHIARLAALYASPKPVALASFFGMGGDYMTDHIVAIKDTALPFSWAPISEEAVARLGNPAPIAENPIWFSAQGLQDELGRTALLPWWWKNGSFLDHLVGEDGWSARLRDLPYEQREAAIPADVAAPFPQLHIDKDFPPSFIAHGEADTAVLPGESKRTYEQLQKAGVRSELRIIPGAHGFMVGPAPSPEAAGVYREGFEFLASELKK
ncbi:hypothetical protein HWV62_30009 [Athelia sp. TMB]|nr:hypothetical protein HWV62_30009 [Athelia sp. TMB]